MSIFPKNHHPAQEALAALERITRAGFPAIAALTPATAWTSGPCPAGHPLVMQGTNLYTADEAETVTMPALILSVDSDSTRAYSNSPYVYRVPCQVGYQMPRNQVANDEDFSRVRAILEAYYTGKAYDEGTGDEYSAAARLSTAADATNPFHVWHIVDVQAGQFASREEHFAAVTINFTLLCCAHGPERGA